MIIGCTTIKAVEPCTMVLRLSDMSLTRHAFTGSLSKIWDNGIRMSDKPHIS